MQSHRTQELFGGSVSFFSHSGVPKESAREKPVGGTLSENAGFWLSVNMDTRLGGHDNIPMFGFSN
jgi:hypothetical protein